MDDQNMDKAFRASELIAKYLEDTLEANEPQELDSWIEESDENRRLFSELTNPAQLQAYLQEFDRINAGKGAALRKIRQRIFMRKMKVFGFVPVVVLRYVAAAAVIAAIAVTGIYLYNRQAPQKAAASKTQGDPGDIPIGDGNAVILTLSDGSTVALDSAKTGLLAQQGGVNVLKQGDQIFYDAGSQNPGITAINSIRTPKGKTYQVVLPDGSKVTLNALTQIEYPTVFAGRNRNVSLEGEAYFDIAADRNKPFTVDVAGTRITVTGTQFNVNGYGNEPTVKTTLFEGGVKITDAGTLEVSLKPGQQLVYDTAAKGYKIGNPDMDATIAWLNNLLNLDNTDVPTLMREIARWYDVEIVYANRIPDGHFEGQIPRNLDFAELVKVLNEGGIKTRLDGRKLVVY
jgi:transmembrane sensor